jgi:hypothetical protein
MTPLHMQARALAEAGIPVFPCAPDAKHPAVANGMYEATTDLEVIDEWWNRDDFNIGVRPDTVGWAVVDIDPGGDGHWNTLANDSGGHGPTYEVQTPRDGRHLYFVGSVPSTVGKLASHVDTRGKGGYVLVPPSVVGGKPYQVLHDRDIVELPRWIADRIAQSDGQRKLSVGELDTPTGLARGESYLRSLLRRGAVAISGAGGNAFTYQVFAQLRDLGVSREKSLGLLLADDGWNAGCRPPWSEEELETIGNNAWQYAQNEPANVDNRSAAEVFGTNEAFREALAKTEKAKSRYRLMSAEDFDNEPEPTWIVQNLIPADSTVLWIGPSQAFKSFLLLDVFLGVASGTQTFGHTPSKGCVLYGALEDLRNVGKTRRRAWQTAKGLSSDKLENFRASMVPYVQEVHGEVDEWCQEISSWLGDRKLALLAIDTAGKVLGGLSENDSTSVRLFGRFCDTLRERFGCSVVAVHHSGKDSERGARGSSAWLADFDSVIETIRPDKTQLSAEVIVRKHKNAADGARWLFKGRNFAGSLVFEPSTTDEYRQVVEQADAFASSKVAKILVERGCRSRDSALISATLFTALGGPLGDEKGVKALEKLAKTKLRPYCTEEDGVTWWWLPEAGRED